MHRANGVDGVWVDGGVTGGVGWQIPEKIIGYGAVFLHYNRWLHSSSGYIHSFHEEGAIDDESVGSYRTVSPSALVVMRGVFYTDRISLFQGVF